MLKEWYTSVKIPSFSQHAEIEKFATNVVGISLSIVKDIVKMKDVRVFISNVPTACIDLEKKQITLSRLYIAENSEDRINPDASEEESLSALFGSAIHEILHLKHTVVPFSTVASMAGIDISSLDDNVAEIAQIVEDIYIDNVDRSSLKNFEWATKSRLNYLFPVEERDEVYGKLTGKISTYQEFDAYMAAMYFLKNFYLKSESKDSFTLRLENMFLQSRSISKVENRLLHAIKIYEFMTSDLPNDKEDVNAKSPSGSDGNAIKPDSADEKIDELRKKLSMSNTEIKSDSEQLSTILQNSERDYEITNENVNVRFEYSNNAGKFTRLMIVNNIDDEFLKSLGFEYSRWSSFTSKNMVIEPDHRFLEFSQLMLARTQTNRPYGLQMNRGSNIRQLYRIATDNRIFAQPNEFEHIGEQEIIILVDISGSMRSDIKLEKAAKAAIGAAIGLQDSRHRIKVVGHTADWDVNGIRQDVVLIILKDWDEDANIVMKPRFEKIIDYDGVMYSNSDDFAIMAVSKMFSELRNQKSLIVISDGMPRGDISLGEEGTRIVVNEIRSQGIVVVSISVDEDAYDSNNYIYGRENNFNTDDAGVVFNVINSIVR